VDLAYRSPADGPGPNFSAAGSAARLTDVPAETRLAEGAIRPAKSGTLQIGPDHESWFPILATADAAHPKDLCRLYIDRNRNGNFSDDGPVLTATPVEREKTKAVWCSFNNVQLSVAYGAGVVEPFMVNLWTVREGDAATSIIRHSACSWRSGKIKVEGIDALVAVMIMSNDAVFGRKDEWAVLAASEPDAAKRVLSADEARPTNRLMFLPNSGKELVLEFRGISPDGRTMTFAAVDRMVTKAEDRAGDDKLAEERARPRTSKPFAWFEGKFDQAMAKAKETGRNLIVDFWTDWCGPCKQLNQWVWTDAEVAALMTENYVGVKLDGDLEKDLVKRFGVAGYPTIIVLDPMGKEVKRFGYLSSKQMLETMKRLAGAARFRGKLDPKVEPGTRVMTPLAEASAEVVAALPAAPGVGDKVWMLKRAPAIDIKGMKYLTAIVVTAAGDKALWLDRNLSGKFDANERWPFAGEKKDVELTLPWNNGIYREFPLKFEYSAGSDSAAPPSVVYNFNLIYSGSVEIDGRKMMLQFYPLPAVVAIDPATIRTAMDTDFSGRIENDRGEVDTGRGKAPVFRSGSRYLAVESVALDTGDIVVEERPAAEYTRFDGAAGQMVPDFSFVDFDGRARKLSDFRGKYVLLDFWGTWCGPCIAEMKELDPIYAEYALHGFEIIGMNIEKTAGRLSAADYKAVNDTARAFIARAGHKWIQATQESIERFAFDVIHVNAYPTTILIAPDGTVVSREAHAKVLTDLLAKRIK
jgi:thiol-disulfide isomerase/thioredoxin